MDPFDLDPLMEPGHPLGYHYPAGTPGPRSESVTFTCDECGWSRPGVLTFDLGAVDREVDCQALEECPGCGQTLPRAVRSTSH